MPSFLPTGSVYDEVYKGFWINRSFGSLRGATLTLDRQAGGIIIAFLALFIAAAARSLWKITRFTICAIESASSNQNGIYHQRQAILRNQPIALNAALDLCRLGYVWRDRARGSQQRILPAILVASIISSASIAAGMSITLVCICICILQLTSPGTLSSRILTNSNNEVLIVGHNCGIYIKDGEPIDYNVDSIMLYTSQKAIDASTYATQCYGGNDTAGSELCEMFTRSKLPFNWRFVT